MKHSPYLLVFLLVLVFFAGCSKKIKVHGSVRFSDGVPLTEGTVFLSDGLLMYHGEIAPDGSFRLGEIREGDGMPPGRYSAWVAANKEEYETDAQGKPTGKRIKTNLIDPKYTNRKTSGLTFEIMPGKRNAIEITVEKP